MSDPCGCEAVTDPESWHRYRKSPMCLDGRERAQRHSRNRYARRIASREGRAVRAYGGKRPVVVPDTWVPGTPIDVEEIEAL